MIQATILADSVHPLTCFGRLTTFELTYPRFVHSEFMTHRTFSRNSASSRAIPTKVLLDQVINNPVIPIHWGKLQKGMQAYQELNETQKLWCQEEWLQARDNAVKTVESLLKIGLHKQIANRLLEPWMHITVIATTNERGLRNFFKLRCHEAAEPHIQRLAIEMRKAYKHSEPTTLTIDKWHAPFSDNIKVSVARTARGSYLQQHGSFTREDDEKLHDRLADMGHWSPFEHQAQATMIPGYGGNLGDGWLQYRKTFHGEDGCSI